MAPAWERARRALAARLCIRFPARHLAIVDAPPELEYVEAPAPAAEVGEEEQEEREKSPAAASPAPALARRLSRSGSRSSAICAICLGGMRSGHGQALFTAECSHKFHFHCISSNVQHGNHVCPICRAVWKELPFQGALLPDAAVHGPARVNPPGWPQGRLSRVNTLNQQDHIHPFRTPESVIFNDDEQINIQPETTVTGGCEREGPALVEMMTYTEFPTVQESVTQENFAILIHLKAPHSPASLSSRAPLDLVTVLDVSGSMAGSKLALLKRATSFVIDSLGHSDRLSIIAFSSTAWRLFPLRKMTAFGKQQSLQAVSSLVANGCTNIAEALWKAARVMEDRQARNPVCSIILLSDGVDHHVSTATQQGPRPDYSQLVPRSILPGSSHHVAVHAFGFGSDHDSATMHAVAEMSGGTFSFIDAVGSIQDAFAQCIGGLLSVVAQETQLSVECLAGGVALTSIKSGGYASRVAADGRGGFVEVGDLYADEERDFLVTVRVPPAGGGVDTALLRPTCTYRDAVTMEAVRLEGDPVIVPRPASPVTAAAMSPQVEREWHRVHATEDMAAARAAAEDNDFARAASILESRRRALESCAALSSDPQTLALVAELREMQDRAENRPRYEESGRAYILAGLSSHSWQRATARGDSTELTGLVHTYQTPSMVDMLHRSQALLPEVVEALNRSPMVAPSRSAVAPGSPPPRRGLRPPFRPTKSFTGRTS